MKKRERHYLRSDGNGGLKMSHSVAIIGLLVMIFLAIIPAAVAFGALSARVDNHYESIEDQEQDLNNVEERLDVYEKDIAIIQTQVTTTNKDVTEIKSDVKELLKNIYK